ncbi:hypothetical protein C900_05019 [Fulvivirga imtechensis AK7]|uniref:DUF3237 domain-containing protein n=2 Tax=Fulvivirga TaxID=396811 RepID=L8JQ27_9BACT|nr:hypothetical protein C900_05019 [Fulvivirga imtechensis AK7]
MNESALLFEEEVRLTNVKEYGFSWERFASGKEPIPAEGLRFDIHFEGDVSGDLVAGTIKGVDYLTVRADGRLFLQLYAAITTNDGAVISVTESGINDNGHLRLNMDFHANDDRYRWLNHKHVWGLGTVNFETGEVKIKGYHR